jgi:hypothetical protein
MVFLTQNLSMARYTHDLTVAVPLSQFYEQVKEVLKACNFEVLYFKEDFVVAREVPGNVPFSRLVTVEVFVDSTRATPDITHFSVVVKNEELPLQVNNHCYQMYEKLNHAITENQGWNLIKSTAENVLG